MKISCLAAPQLLLLICALLPAAATAESYTSQRGFTVEYGAPWTRVNGSPAELMLSCDPFICGPDVFLTFNASYSERLKNIDTAEFVRNMFLRDETRALGLTIINRLMRSPDVYSALLVSEGESWSQLKNAKAYEVVADVTFTDLKRSRHQVFTTSNAGYVYTISLRYPHETRAKAVWAAEAVLDSFRFLGNSPDPVLQAPLAAAPPSSLLGRIEEDQYVSPGNLYRVRIPHLMQPGAVIEDRRLGESRYELIMRDDLGTLYSILVARSEGRTAVADIEEEVLSGGQIREQDTVNTARGVEARFLLLKSKGSHLQGFDLREKTATTPDLIQATSIFALDGYVFAVTAGKASLGQFLEPPSDNEHVSKLAREQLDRFLDGLMPATDCTSR